MVEHNLISVPPSMQDIARQAGVSTATVSLVMNGRNGVSAETRQSVQEIVNRLGYVPRPGGRPRGPKTASGCTNMIALVAPGITRAALNAPVYMDVLHGVEAALAEAGKTMVLRHLPQGVPASVELLPQKVDGVVLFGSTQVERLVRRLREVPCVQVMGVVTPEGLWDHVSYANAPIGTLAADYLLSRNHRHAAFVSSGRATFFVERGEVFKRAMAAGGGDSLEFVDEALVDVSGSIEQAIPERMQALMDGLLAARPRPTAAFLVADILAQGFYDELQRRGLIPGCDLDVICCNNEQSLLAHLKSRPATIDIHAETVGRKAVEQLLWRLDHPSEPRVTMVLEPTLVAGNGKTKEMLLRVN